MACRVEAEAYIKALDALAEIDVNPRKAMRDLYRLAEERSPKLAEAVKRWGKVISSRRELIRCTYERLEEI